MSVGTSVGQGQMLAGKLNDNAFVSLMVRALDSQKNDAKTMPQEQTRFKWF